MKRFDESGNPPADAGRIELRNRTPVEFGRIAADGSIPITINALADVHAIDPRIYGVNFGGTAAGAYGSLFDRQGGNAQSRYNWQLNSDNRGKDWYYESIADSNSTAGFRATSHVQAAHAIGGQAMLTMPMIGWTSKLGTNRAKKWSYSVAKYGSQQSVDP
ncbi:MAG: glycoside hydrolase family 44 protein, partial [Armatimonadaceae bacterium]